MTSAIDLLITKYTDPTTKEPITDFVPTRDGVLQELYAESAIKQRAVVASFTQRGTIPQLPNVGVEWAELITEQRSPAEINSQIFDAMHEHADTYAYVPAYSTEDDMLVVTIKENS